MAKQHRDANALSVDALRQLSTPCCLWLVSERQQVEPIIFNGFAMRGGTEEIAKWVTSQAHFANSCVFWVNESVFFYQNEQTARLGIEKYFKEETVL